VSATPDLDHVALATTDAAATLDTLVGDLGGIVFHGGDGVGFRWVQTRLGTATDGMTVETLVVWRPEDDDFLARFVARHGDGAHHVTFKVPDLPAVLEHCRVAGLTPVGVRLEDPHWREAFLMPREAHGTVVQLAETDEPHAVADLLARTEIDGPIGEPAWWPAPPARAAEPVTLRHVVIGSPDRAATLGFFRTLLGGEPEATDPTGTTLVWPGGGRIRVEDGPRAGVVRLDASGGPPREVDVAGVSIVVP
jgi:catechol 2,3-dioxygenase-like lactoylglutathione lyase family enzyme